MLKYLNISVLLLLNLICHAQQPNKPALTQDILSTTGNQLFIDRQNPFVTFTVGEPIVQTIIGNSNIASQGFQQPFFIRIPCNIFIANAFTPHNFDSNNDEFGPIHECSLVISKFSVYNRWGELIFQSFDEHPTWDGTHEGEKCQSGLYPWTLEYRKADSSDGKIETMRGAVTLIY